MPATVIPVGQFLGEVVFPAADVSREERTYGVRLGVNIEELNEDEFGVWALAHGTGQSQRETSRGAIESLAVKAKLADASEVFDRLLRRGLLVRVVPVSSGVQGFAETHQLLPLGVGLGNSIEKLAAFDIGQPGFPRSTLSAAMFDLWAFSALSASLWQACEQAADGSADSWGEDITPADLAKLVVQALPVLLATDAAYVDVCTTAFSAKTS